jgi:beta-phosphoglucomutase-like phosphatase (HAD superfamily)
VEGLIWLKSHSIPAAVVSNARRNELESTLRHLKIFDFFSEILSREDVVRFKPDPMPYLLAAATLGIEIQNCLVVEDSPTGLEAGLVAGAPTVAVETTFPKNALKFPVPGRPDLTPLRIEKSPQAVFEWLKRLPE